MNEHAHYQRGTLLEINQRRYRCDGRGPKGRLKLQDLKRKSFYYLAPEQINDYVLDGRARVLPPDDLDGFLNPPKPASALVADLSALSQCEQEATHRRYDYVQAIKNACLPGLTGPRMKPVIEAEKIRRQDIIAPHWRTVVTWVRSYDASSSVLALVHERRGNSHGRIDRNVEALIEMAVQEHYLTQARKTLKDTLKHLQLLILNENQLLSTNDHLVSPSYRALRRYVGRLDKFEVMARRYGELYARRWFKAYGAGAIAVQPLEIVQVDHTILDVEVVYLGLLRLGKPTVTVVLDTYSRMIMAIEITFEPPSYVCVMEALRFAILPKTELVESLKQKGILKKDWPIFGVPNVLLLDNGKEFRGNDLKNAAAHLGMTLRFSPPRQPWFKGAIERFLLTMKNELIAQLPSRTFPVREDQPEGEKSAWAIDLEDLRRVLWKWAVDVYHETPHSTTGFSPRKMLDYAQRGEKWF